MILDDKVLESSSSCSIEGGIKSRTAYDGASLKTHEGKSTLNCLGTVFKKILAESQLKNFQSEALCC